MSLVIETNYDLLYAVENNIDLNNWNCKGLNFKGINLSGFNINGINLKGSILSDSRIICSESRQVTFTAVDMSKSDLRYTDFTHSIFIDTDISGSDIRGCDFTGAIFTGINITSCVYDKTTIFPEGFDPMSFSMVIVNNDNDADKNILIKSKEEIVEDVKNKRDLSGYDVRIQVYDLMGAKLKGAIFRKSILNYMNFGQAILELANFTGAQLQGAIFFKAQLQGAILVGAVLDDADLVGANLSGADLRDIKYNEHTKFRRAIYSKLTKFPKGFDPKKYDMILKNVA